MTDYLKAVSNTPPPAKTAQPVPMERGKVYDTAGPRGEKMVVMLYDTWEDFGTNFASLRNALANQSRQVQELQAGEKILLARLSAVTTRLENLRAVRRAEKRPEVEASLGLPPTTIEG